MSSSRVILKNIPKYYVEKSLKKHIEKELGFCTTDLRILRNQKGHSRRVAFVGVKDEKTASFLVQKVNKTFIDTSRIEASIAYPSGSHKIPRPWSKYSEGSSLNKKIKKRKLQILDNVKPKTEQANGTPVPLGETRSKNTVEENKVNQDFVNFLFRPKGQNTWRNDDMIQSSISNSKPETDSDMLEELNLQKNNTLRSKNYSILPGSITAKSNASSAQKETVKSSLGGNRQHDLTTDKFFRRQSGEGSDEAVIFPVKKKNLSNIRELDLELIKRTSRILILNLPYSTTKEELQIHLSGFGEVEEIHVCFGKDRLSSKGRAFVKFTKSLHAIQAATTLHQSIFQGRLLRVVASLPKKKMGSVSKVTGSLKKNTSSYKKELEEKQISNAGNKATWNLLYVSPESVLEPVVDKLKMCKEDILGVDQTRDNLTVAAKVALSETFVVQQTKIWLKDEGLKIEAFERQGINLLQAEVLDKRKNIRRSDDCIIIKHLPSDTTDKELFELVSRYGLVVRYSLSPSRNIAVVQYLDTKSAQAAFNELAYHRFKQRPLFLEWAPEDVYSIEKPAEFLRESRSLTVQTQITDSYILGKDIPKTNEVRKNAKEEAQEDEEKDKKYDFSDEESRSRCCVFVKNLNFNTDTDKLKQVFQNIFGFQTAKIVKKVKPLTQSDIKLKSKTESVSSGYGFLEFSSKNAAVDAIKKCQGTNLDGHVLYLQLSEKSLVGPEVRTDIGNSEQSVFFGNEDSSIISKKLCVRNLAFQANKKDLLNLFSTFGSVVSVRIPKKADSSSRGYGFVVFSRWKDALTAMEALQHTHLYGRKLIIEPARLEEENLVRKKAFEEKVMPENSYSVACAKDDSE